MKAHTMPNVEAGPPRVAVVGDTAVGEVAKQRISTSNNGGNGQTASTFLGPSSHTHHGDKVTETLRLELAPRPLDRTQVTDLRVHQLQSKPEYK